MSMKTKVAVTLFALVSVCVNPLLAVPSLPGANRDVEENERVAKNEKAEVLRLVMSDPTTVYKKFRQACIRDFQQPEKLRVEIHPTPMSKLIGGFFSQVNIKAIGGGVDYAKLEKFRLRCKGVHFDLEKLMNDGLLVVRRVDKMDLALTVNEEAFNKVFATHAHRMRVQNPRIRMYDNELSFSGSIKAFIFKSRISARGPIELTKDGRVNFNLRRLKVSGINLPRFMVKQIARTVNPITDFKDFKFWDCWNMNLKACIVRPGSLTLSSFEEDVPQADKSMMAKSAAIEKPCLSKAGVFVLE